MSWDIKNPLAVLEKGSLEYATRIDALYEFLKNHTEADAYQVFLDIDTKNHTIVISGDGRGLDAEEIQKNVCSVAQSRKDMSHHGLGQIHAFLRLASKFTFVSKKIDATSLVNCIPREDHLVDEIPPREMTIMDHQLYGKYLGRLKKWPHGTAIILEGVGKRSSKVHDFSFIMKEEFEEKLLIKKLQEKLLQELESRKFHLKINDDKSKRIPAKIGQGKKINFTMPSINYSCKEVTSHTFEYVDRKFALFLTFKLWMSSGRQNEPIWISQEGKDNITLETAFRDRRNIAHTVFSNSNYSPYLSGYVSFKVKALDKDELPSFYSGSRQNIITDSSFGKCLINMLIWASANYLQPIMQKYLEEKDTSKDVRRSHNLTDDLSNFFRTHTELSSEIFQQNEGTVPVSKIHCRSCNASSEAVRVSPEQFNSGPWDPVIYTCGESYRCGSCGSMWDKGHRGPNAKAAHKPIYNPPKPGSGSGERKRRRGYGYSCVVMRFLDSSSIWKQDKDYEILINSKHVTYQRWKNISKKRGFHPNPITLYERRVALEAIISIEHKNIPEAVRYRTIRGCLEKFQIWYYEGRSEELSEPSTPAVSIPKHAEVAKVYSKKIPMKEKTVQDLAKKWGKL